MTCAKVWGRTSDLRQRIKMRKLGNAGAWSGWCLIRLIQGFINPDFPWDQWLNWSQLSDDVYCLHSTITLTINNFHFLFMMIIFSWAILHNCIMIVIRIEGIIMGSFWKYFCRHFLDECIMILSEITMMLNIVHDENLFVSSVLIIMSWF